VPRYLEVSLDSLTREQAKFREQVSQAFGMGGFGAIEDQVRRNMDMFERTFAMFAPFARQSGQGGGQGGGQTGPGAPEADKEPKPAASTGSAAGGGDINDLKRQMEEIQRRLDRLGDKS
jgi:polyhydroxyalkanoate synthesis regulator protein